MIFNFKANLGSVHLEIVNFWTELSALSNQQSAKPLFLSLLLNAEC